MMKNRIDHILGGFLAFLMAMITLVVLWGVFTRYALGSQASWSEELARFLLVWIGLLGAAYASGQKMHLAIDLLSPSLSVHGQKNIQTLISILIIVFVLAVMIVGGIRLIYITFYLEQTSAALQLPMGVLYGVIPLSGILIIYYKLNELLTA